MITLNIIREVELRSVGGREANCNEESNYSMILNSTGCWVKFECQHSLAFEMNNPRENEVIQGRKVS